MAKKIRETGIVMSKFVKPAMEGFIANGQAVSAMPERPTVMVACGEINGNDGIQDMVVVKYVVEMGVYNRLKYLDKIEVAYEYNGDGRIKPLEIIPIK